MADLIERDLVLAQLESNVHAVRGMTGDEEVPGLLIAQAIVKDYPASTRYAELEQAARELMCVHGQDVRMPFLSPCYGEWNRIDKALRAIHTALTNLDKEQGNE